MYSVVLMMALGNGTATPTHDAALARAADHSTGHYAYRGGRHGCCGCNGGHERGHRGHRGHQGGCCGNNYCGSCGSCDSCGYCGSSGYDRHDGHHPATGTRETAIDSPSEDVATIVVSIPQEVSST